MNVEKEAYFTFNVFLHLRPVWRSVKSLLMNKLDFSVYNKMCCFYCTLAGHTTVATSKLSTCQVGWQEFVQVVYSLHRITVPWTPVRSPPSPSTSGRLTCDCSVETPSLRRATASHVDRSGCCGCLSRRLTRPGSVMPKVSLIGRPRIVQTQ